MSLLSPLSSVLPHPQQEGGYADLRWHFIGNLQRNKTHTLTSTPGLWMVESVGSEKVARSLDKHWSLNDMASGPLRVLVQVNTSCEESE